GGQNPAAGATPDRRAEVGGQNPAAGATPDRPRPTRSRVCASLTGGVDRGDFGVRLVAAED
ncbi:hypothetical protein L6V77_32315, partial [Myxococcota bacterium]|nr:hypothetical protein [Myxococcota bacterium]